MASRAKEDYLKAIYACEEMNGIAKTTKLAGMLGVRAATVTEMIQRLAKEPDQSVVYKHHQGVRLTPAGRKVALGILRKHRLLETFLHETLKLSWEEVHEEAEILEHHISIRVTEAIDRHLGFPKFDPHGEPIPDPDGNMAHLSQMPLSQVNVNNTFSIISVDPVSGEFLTRLKRIGIGIGTTGCMLPDEAEEDSFSIVIDSRKGKIEAKVARDVADRIFVKKN